MNAPKRHKRGGSGSTAKGMANETEGKKAKSVKIGANKPLSDQFGKPLHKGGK